MVTRSTIWKSLVVGVFVAIICLCVLYFGVWTKTSGSVDRPMKLLIDTDAGTDDALAILLALAAPELVQVVAVTCSYGNTELNNVEVNVLKILTTAGRADIPVYSGAKEPLLQSYTAGDYFGKDGLGDFEFEQKIIGNVDRSKHASLAMIELANRYPGDISIITLGPLTNVALAASLDPNFTQNVKRFYVMGSKVNELEEAPRTETEYNFSLDSESNAIFLNSSTKNTSLIIPWDVVHNNKINKEWRTGVLGKSNSEIIQFLNKAEAIILERLKEWQCADAMAIATAIWPDIVTSSVEAHMTSDNCNPFKGSVHVQMDDLCNKTKNVEIVRKIDLSALKDKLLLYSERNI